MRSSWIRMWSIVGPLNRPQRMNTIRISVCSHGQCTSFPVNMIPYKKVGETTNRVFLLYGIRDVKLIHLLTFCGTLMTFPAHAESPMAAQVCSLLASPSLSSVQSRMGTGEGCAWQWPNGQALSVYVHIDQQSETAAGTKQMIDMFLQNPAFKRTAFPVCTGGDMVVGDFRNGKGPGGTGYTQCSGFVLTFSFQGADAQNQLPGIAKKLASTTFAR